MATQEARKEDGIVGIGTASGEMWAAALDAEPSALLAKFAIESEACVRCPKLEKLKPKHSESFSESSRCQFAVAHSHGLAVGDAEEGGRMVQAERAYNRWVVCRDSQTALFVSVKENLRVKLKVLGGLREGKVAFGSWEESVANRK